MRSGHEIGQQDRDCSIGTDQAYGPESHEMTLWLQGAFGCIAESLSGAYAYGGILATALDKSFDGCKTLVCWTADDEKLSMGVRKGMNEGISGVAAVEEHYTARRDASKEFECFVTLGGIHWRNGPGDTYSAEHVVDGRDQALGIVAFAVVGHAAAGVKNLPHLFCSRQAVSGAINGKHIAALPGVLRGLGPAPVSQVDGIVEDVAEETPRDFPSSFAHGTAMDVLCTRP